MSNKYLLDTGVANHLAKEDAAILRRVAAVEGIAIPVVAFGELYYGAYLYAHRHASTKYLDLYDYRVQCVSRGHSARG